MLTKIYRFATTLHASVPAIKAGNRLSLIDMAGASRVAEAWSSMSMKISIGSCAVFALCTSCAIQPSSPPPTELPAAFENTLASTPHWPGKDWYQGFASDELNTLIALAEQNNADLAAAQARIRQADARARAAGAAILPQVDAGANVAHLAGRSGSSSAHETDWSALLSASYEVDFWGKNRATADSATLLTAASTADRDTLVLTTLSGVASTYFQLLSLRERLDIAEENLATARQVLEVIEARYNVGMASPVELATQKAAVANAQLVLPQLLQQEIEIRGSLALLVGRNPEGFDVTGDQLDVLTEPMVTPGLPSELLVRRPDILAAETSLQAAHADIAAARAALFPTLTLTGSGGLQNPAVQAAVTTLDGTGLSLSLGASLVQTIFDGGRRRAQRDEAQARAEELLASYRGAILAALLDVETSLAAIRSLDLQQAAQTENAAQSERAFLGAQLRYREGSGDFLTVLDAQRSLYAAREQMSQYKLARLQAVIGLCKALGGGWQRPATSPIVQSEAAQSGPGL
jgi:outer membrane protein, multidrug efflux system